MSSTSSPYKNTYGRRRRRRRYYKGRRAATYKIAQKAARREIAKKEREVVEMKSYDITFINGSTISFNGLVTPLTSPISKGTEPFNRIGSEIHLKGILIRLQLVPAAQFNNVRCIAIRWNSSGTPSASNILQFTGTNAAPFSPLIRDASHKFQVLYDNLFVIGTDQADGIKVEKIYLKKLGTAVWDDSNGPQKGQIFFLTISGASLEMPGLFMQSRARYTDQ